MRTRSLIFKTLAAATALSTVLTGCRSELYDQQYGEPLEKTSFYDDGRISRPLIAGTVARGQLRDDDLLYTGSEGGSTAGADSGAQAAPSFSNTFPFEVTKEVVLRGQERFNIYCAPCHGYAGDGDGIIVQRGMKQPPSFHDERLRTTQAGYFFHVITNGFGVMYPYASRVKPNDRWAIVAYIRALQRARSGETASTNVSTPIPATSGAGTQATPDTSAAG